MLVIELQHKGSRARHVQERDADTVLKHPAGRGVLAWLPLLGGNRGLGRFEGVPEAVLQSGIATQAHGHDPQERHAPLRFLESARRRAKARRLQQPEAPLGVLRPCVPCEEFQRRQGRAVKVVGREHDPALLRHQGVTNRPGRGHRPGDLVDQRVGGRGLPRPTPLLEGFGFCGARFQPGLIDRALRLGAAACGGNHDPAWGNAAVVGREELRAIPLHRRAQGLRVGLGQRVLGFGQRGRDAGDPLAARLGDLLEVRCPLQGPVCDEGGQARRGLPVGHGVGNHRPESARRAGSATEWLQQPGDARLVFHDQGAQHWIPVRALLAAVALGAREDRFVGLRPPVVAASNMQARALQMDTAGCYPEAWGSGGRNERREFCNPMGVAGLQGAPQRVSSAVRGVKAGGNEPLGWFVLKKPGPAVQWLVHNPQAVEHHGFDGVAKGDEPRRRVVRSRSVNDLTKATFVKHPRDEAEMSHALTGG
jgi:hypothetical protein